MKYVIVDPDMQNGIELMKILDGYEMLEFHGCYATLKTAEDYIDEHPPDIAFICLGKAELNAFRLTCLIRLRNPLSKVIFISSLKENAVEAFEYEADGFLLTPFSKKKISQLLLQHMKKEG